MIVITNSVPRELSFLFVAFSRESQIGNADLNPQMNKAYLSLGSNEGNRKLWLAKALNLVEMQCGEILQKSAIYKTAAWGITDQPEFLNMVMCVRTSKTPDELLHCILTIETTLGRHRGVKWGPRIIDIDILLFNNDIIDTPELVIPHPFMQDRRFTLTPLAEIAPEYVHPKLHKTIRALLEICPDRLEVVIDNSNDD